MPMDESGFELISKFIETIERILIRIYGMYFKMPNYFQYSQFAQ